MAWQKIEEIQLARENPFTRLLSRRNLLAEPAAEPASASAEDPLAGKIPNTGDSEAWRTLAEILLSLPRVDKDLLAQKAGEKKLGKQNLNDKLGLGLDAKQWKKSWDEVLKRFAATGLLDKEEEGFVLAGRQSPEAPQETQETTPHDRALQNVIDHYVGAMAKRWQEAD